MLGIDRKAARCTFTVAMVVLLLYLVYMVRQTLFIFVLALLFAYLLSPLVDLLDRFLPRRITRTAALALVYVVFVGLVVVIGIQVGSRVVEQSRDLATRLPAMVDSAIRTWQTPYAKSAAIESLKQQIAEKVRTEAGNLFSGVAQAGLTFLSVASKVIYVVIIPILAFFFLKDAPTIRQHVLDIVTDGPRRELLQDLLTDINLLLAHYMRALVALSLSAFTAYAIFFSIVGVPYSILLAALGGFLEFIPTLGPLAAAVMIVVVAAVAGANVWAVIICLVVYRVVQDYVFLPHLMGQGVQLHPLLVLFGVFAGAEVAGIPGAFLSVPVLAMARIVYLRFRKARMGTLYTSSGNLGS